MYGVLSNYFYIEFPLNSLSLSRTNLNEEKNQIQILSRDWK